MKALWSNRPAGYAVDIEAETAANRDFRRVLYTTPRSQLVLMSLAPGEDIGFETHPFNDQFVRIEAGTGTCTIGGVERELRSGTAVVIPAGFVHNVVNTSDTDRLQLYTIYSPPQHKDGTVHHTKADSSE